MAPGLKLFKRQAEEGDEGEEEPTTLSTHIFGKHLHKVRVTTTSATSTTEGEFSFSFEHWFRKLNWFDLMKF